MSQMRGHGVTDEGLTLTESAINPVSNFTQSPIASESATKPLESESASQQTEGGLGANEYHLRLPFRSYIAIFGQEWSSHSLGPSFALG